MSIAFHMKDMHKDRIFIRKYQNCETCGAVTVVMTDKTGVLTKNALHIENFYVANATEDNVFKLLILKGKKKISYFDQLMVLNTSFSTGCMLGEGDKVIGNMITGGFLIFSRDMYRADYEEIRRGLTVEHNVDKAVVHHREFSPNHKRMSMLVDLSLYKAPENVSEAVEKLRTKGQYLSVCRGDAEIMLKRCVLYLNPETGEVDILSAQMRLRISEQISSYNS